MVKNLQHTEKSNKNKNRRKHIFLAESKRASSKDLSLSQKLSICQKQ